MYDDWSGDQVASTAHVPAKVLERLGTGAGRGNGGIHGERGQVANTFVFRRVVRWNMIAHIVMNMNQFRGWSFEPRASSSRPC